MTTELCPWCTYGVPATTTVVIEDAIPADPEKGTPAVHARTAPACPDCRTRLEGQRAADARARYQAEHGSRLPIVDGQGTLEQELAAHEAPEPDFLEPGDYRRAPRGHDRARTGQAA